MTDIVLGMGQVGKTLFRLLEERGFNCVGIDIDKSRLRNYADDHIEDHPYLHVCLPGDLTEFVDIVLGWIKKVRDLRAVLIHSTVRPGTTRCIQERTEVPVLFTPVRGVHKRFLTDMKRYTKFIASDKQIDPKIRTELQERFRKTDWMSSTKTAELAKILVDTTYYGWLISYAQITKMICERENVDYDEIWKFADEIHDNLGNRPKMYPGIIGGHCIIPNLDLIKHENLDIIKSINEMYEKFKE